MVIIPSFLLTICIECPVARIENLLLRTSINIKRFTYTNFNFIFLVLENKKVQHKSQVADGNKGNAKLVEINYE